MSIPDGERTGWRTSGITFTHAVVGDQVIQFEEDGSATNITEVLEIEAELHGDSSSAP